MKLRHFVLFAGLLAVLGASCGDNNGFTVPEPTQSDNTPSTTPDDRVASCDGAEDGRLCGDGGRSMHCIFNACTLNACGDGFKGGDEQCDDGAKADGDGCSARCKREECGNSIKDLGEECDDGNADLTDSCVECRVATPVAVPDGGVSDAGANLDGGDVGECPTSVTLHADPNGGRQSDKIELSGPSAEGVAYLWSVSAGTLGTPGSANTSYICSNVDVVLTRLAKKPGCLPTADEIAVTCLAPPVVLDDAGVMDATVPADAAAPSEAGAKLDAGSGAGAKDAGMEAGSDASAGVSAACLSCITTGCSSYLDINFVAPCFQNNTTNQFEPTGNPEVQPLFTQRCTDTVNCSLAAPSKCADDTIGPARCYCGNQTITACLASGPVAGAECVKEWNAAAECPVGDYACTIGANFSDLSRPSGYANTIIECANAVCATACGLTE